MCCLRPVLTPEPLRQSAHGAAQMEEGVLDLCDPVDSRLFSVPTAFSLPGLPLTLGANTRSFTFPGPPDGRLGCKIRSCVACIGRGRTGRSGSLQQ